MQNITLSDIASLFIRQLKWLLIGLVVGALLLSMYTVLLVDDIVTTGSTLAECAGVLRKAGCKAVYAAAAAMHRE